MVRIAGISAVRIKGGAVEAKEEPVASSLRRSQRSRRRRRPTSARWGSRARRRPASRSRSRPRSSAPTPSATRPGPAVADPSGPSPAPRSRPEHHHRHRRHRQVELHAEQAVRVRRHGAVGVEGVEPVGLPQVGPLLGGRPVLVVLLEPSPDRGDVAVLVVDAVVVQRVRRPRRRARSTRCARRQRSALPDALVWSRVRFQTSMAISPPASGSIAASASTSEPAPSPVELERPAAWCRGAPAGPAPTSAACAARRRCAARSRRAAGRAAGRAPRSGRRPPSRTAPPGGPWTTPSRAAGTCRRRRRR